MADEQEWFEVDDVGSAPNLEAARELAQQAAEAYSRPVGIYRCTRTLVRTFQRSVTVTETDASA